MELLGRSLVQVIDDFSATVPNLLRWSPLESYDFDVHATAVGYPGMTRVGVLEGGSA